MRNHTSRDLNTTVAPALAILLLACLSQVVTSQNLISGFKDVQGYAMSKKAALAEQIEEYN